MNSIAHSSHLYGRSWVWALRTWWVNSTFVARPAKKNVSWRKDQVHCNALTGTRNFIVKFYWLAIDMDRHNFVSWQLTTLVVKQLLISLQSIFSGDNWISWWFINTIAFIIYVTSVLKATLPLAQYSHLNGCSASDLCLRNVCLSKLLFVLNFWLHTSHVYGFKFAWLDRWAINCDLVANVRPEKVPMSLRCKCTSISLVLNNLRC